MVNSVIQRHIKSNFCIIHTEPLIRKTIMYAASYIYVKSVLNLIHVRVYFFQHYYGSFTMTRLK